MNDLKTKFLDLQESLEATYGSSAFAQHIPSLADLFQELNEKKQLPERLLRLREQINENINGQQLGTLLLALEQVLNISSADVGSRFFVEKEDREESKEVEKKGILVVDRVVSAFNIGQLFRIAECLGIEKVILCSPSPTPSCKKVQKTAMGTTEIVDWEESLSTVQVVKKLKREGVQIISLETCSNFQEKSSYQKRWALVVGHERWGISPRVLALSDCVLSLPMRGRKNSLNVAVAAGIGVSYIKGL